MAYFTTLLNRLHPPPPVSAPRTQSQSKAATTAAADFHALFTTAAPATAPSTAPPADPDAPPTAQSVFGASPWQSNPLGRNPNGTQFSYNPIYFASAATAAQVAQMLGGSVVQNNALAPSAQEQPNYMVQMPDGRMINPGLVAAFYTHGYPQSYIDGLIASQISGTAT